MLDKIVGDAKNIQWIKERTIFLTLHGSWAYGTAVPGSSDEDWRGVCIPPKEYFHGFANNFDQIVRNDPDAQIFDIRKFFSLAYKSNPNIIEVLFTDESEHKIVTKLGRELLDNRDAFISRAAKSSFLGYAKSQAVRIRRHRRWILEGVKAPPSRKDFNLPEKPPIKKQDKEVIFALIRKKLDSWNVDFDPFSEVQKIYLQDKLADILTEMKLTSDTMWEAAARTLGLEENFIKMLIAEKEFSSQESDYNEYQNWLTNRNPVRAALEEKYGYDCKHGGHLIRLCRMGKEILTEGKVIVKRPDFKELLEIRNGSWSYEKLVAYAEQLEKEVEEAYLNCKLPAMPDRAFLDNLCQKLVEASF